jgi:fucose 4-O-acetylase-like acetyltransferase
VSTTPVREEYRAADAVAGILASMSIFASLTGIFWHPLRLIIASILIALIAAGLSRRYQLLAGIAVAVGGLSWILGMTIAVITGHPLW